MIIEQLLKFLSILKRLIDLSDFENLEKIHIRFGGKSEKERMGLARYKDVIPII